jgi:hypothetical protein
MRIHRQNGLTEPPAGRQDHTTDAQARRSRWRWRRGDRLGDFMAGLHVTSVLLLHELHEATGEPSAAVLQRLAMMAERQRGTPSAG